MHVDAERKRHLTDAARQGNLNAFDSPSASYERQLHAFAPRPADGRDLAGGIMPKATVRA